MDLYKGIDIPDVEFFRMEKHAYVAGEFVWTGIDYLREPVPFDDKARSSYFGIVDLMGVPKDRFYLYRAHWNCKADTVHVVPHWNWENSTVKKRDVFVYTNGDEAELFLNGKSLGRRVKGGKNPYSDSYFDPITRYRLIWRDVEFEPGELKAVSYMHNKVIGTHVVRTAKAPVAVVAEQEKLQGIEKDELRWVQLSVCDGAGMKNPLAMDMLEFSISGPGKIVAVGNGDPTAMKSFAETDSHALFCGKATAVVRRTGEGEITFRAAAKGLKSAEISIK
jgi:beta-galactosidase